MAGSRAALASPTRLNATATRRSAATTSGRRSSSADGSPAGTSPGKPGSCGAMAAAADGIAAEQELERSNRLLASQLELTQDVAIAADAGARDEHVLLTADADALRGRRPGARAPRSREWFRAPPRPAARPRWRGTSSWPRAPQSTGARTRNPPAPTRLARRSPPGRSARGPRGRPPRSPRARRPGGPSRRPTSCRRRARGDRPTGTASRPPVWRRAAPARPAPRRRADRRCARSLRRPPPSADRRGTPRASCRPPAPAPAPGAVHCAGVCSVGQRLLLDGRRIRRLLQRAARHHHRHQSGGERSALA